MIREITASLLLLISQTERPAQSVGRPTILPRPTGAFGIGRVTYHWVDSSRAEFLDPHAASRRELMVDVWYPAGRGVGRPRAPYLPDLAHLTRVLGDSVVRRQFAPAYAAVESGLLQTHATDGPPTTCSATGCPLVIFSHGGGVDRSFYTSQYEDLASHGYLVAVPAHTDDTHLVLFPDGRAIAAAPQPRDSTPPDPSIPAWRSQLQKERRSEAYVRSVIEVEANDIRFVIDQLTKYARDRSLGAPFVGQLNLKQIGALGHSAGGEAAALTCQLDVRIGACLNEDGVMHNLPFARDAAGMTMRQPFMYMGREYKRPALSDHQLAAMQISRMEAESLFHAIANGQDELLTDISAGAYRVTLRVPGVTHMSFSDELLIEAIGDSVKTANALLSLTIITTYSRAFFDQTLLGRRATVLDHADSPGSAFVTVDRFGPKNGGRRSAP